MNFIRTPILSLIGVIFAFAQTSANAFTTLDYPGAAFTTPNDINDAGQIVGDYAGGHGFLYSHGKFATIDVPGAQFTVALGINNAGQIVGYYRDDTTNHGFLYSSGKFTTIDVPGADLTGAAGINDAGDIVGWTNHEGFRKVGGTFSTIAVPNDGSNTLTCCTSPDDINASGQIVGYYVGPPQPWGLHGFLYSGGNYVPIDAPGAVSSIGESTTMVQGINDAGHIVGEFSDKAGYHGFAYDGKRFEVIDLPTDLPENSTGATGINNAGEIVGDFEDFDGRQHGFLISEPQVLVMLGVALVALRLGWHRNAGAPS
jgi:probable HAF family extracellular repeat protein